jgi:predicted DNA-binding transcriptional regulator AlpA
MANDPWIHVHDAASPLLQKLGVIPEEYLLFADLKRLGICRNWTTLQRWIEKEGFPRGIKLAANTRVWPKREIAQWLASRPSAGERKAG